MNGWLACLLISLFFSRAVLSLRLLPILFCIYSPSFATVWCVHDNFCLIEFVTGVTLKLKTQLPQYVWYWRVDFLSRSLSISKSINSACQLSWSMSYKDWQLSHREANKIKDTNQNKQNGAKQNKIIHQKSLLVHSIDIDINAVECFCSECMPLYPISDFLKLFITNNKNGKFAFIEWCCHRRRRPRRHLRHHY